MRVGRVTGALFWLAWLFSASLSRSDEGARKEKAPVSIQSECREKDTGVGAGQYMELVEITDSEIESRQRRNTRQKGADEGEQSA